MCENIFFNGILYNFTRRKMQKRGKRDGNISLMNKNLLKTPLFVTSTPFESFFD